MTGVNVDEIRKLHELANRPRVQHVLAQMIDDALFSQHCFENPQASIRELTADLLELQGLLSRSAKVDTALRGEIQKTQHILEELKLEAQRQETEAKSKELRTAGPLVEIKRYAWDQSDLYVKVYVSLDGLTGDRNQVDCQFHPDSLEVKCLDVSGMNYGLTLGPLCEAIDPKQSSVLVKPGRFTLKLKKCAKLEWSGLDNSAKLQKIRHEQLVNTGATTAELLANMYAQADDETRRGLAEAAHQGRLKREEQNRQTLTTLGIAP